MIQSLAPGGRCSVYIRIPAQVRSSVDEHDLYPRGIVSYPNSDYVEYGTWLCISGSSVFFRVVALSVADPDPCDFAGSGSV